MGVGVVGVEDVRTLPATAPRTKIRDDAARFNQQMSFLKTNSRQAGVFSQRVQQEYAEATRTPLMSLPG